MRSRIVYSRDLWPWYYAYYVLFSLYGDDNGDGGESYNLQPILLVGQIAVD